MTKDVLLKNSLEGFVNWLQVGAFLLFLAVALGAFGAHGLEKVFDAKQLDVWQKAVNYMVIHGLAILFVSGLLWKFSQLSRDWKIALWSFLLGVLLFSGSLILWALTAIKWLVFLTPIGGSLFLLGWVWLFFSAKKITNLEV